MVIGPAEDGGYYLLALRAPRPELFAGIAWSTPTVCDETLRRAAASALAVHRLPRRRDIDTLEDLRLEWPRMQAILAAQPDLLETLRRALGPSVPGG